MGGRVPVELAGKRFANKGLAKKFFQEIQEGARNEGRLGQPIDDEREISIIEALLETHGNYEEKVGTGIKYFFVDYVNSLEDANSKFIPRKKAVAIMIMRTDGSRMDFSWRKLLDHYGANPTDIRRDRVKSALRGAVEPFRRELRENAFREGKVITCPHSGKIMTNYAQAKIIYESPSWKELTEEFVSQEGGWENIRLVEPSDDAQLGMRLSDPEVEERWIAYWRENSRPLIVSKDSKDLS